jgi:hypothetical protein
MKKEWVIVDSDGTVITYVQKFNKQFHVAVGQVFVKFKTLKDCRIWAKENNTNLIHQEKENK